jgi:hypothetical protein
MTKPEFVSVPREPTDEIMRLLAQGRCVFDGVLAEGWKPFMRQLWAEILAAAPSPEPRAVEGKPAYGCWKCGGRGTSQEFDHEREPCCACNGTGREPAPQSAPAPLTEDPLRYEIDNGRLVVSIGVKTLADALQQGPEWGNEFRITDAAVFAQAVVAELETDEDEIGETSITRALTRAAERAIESAADGVEEIADHHRDSVGRG